MPSQTKKKPITRKSTTKKTVAKKKPVKRKTRKGKKESSVKKNFFIVLSVFLMITFVVLGYYLGKNTDDTQTLKTAKKSTFEEYSSKKTLLDQYKTKAEDLKKKASEKKKPAKNVVVEKGTVKKEVVTKTYAESKPVQHRIIKQKVSDKPKIESKKVSAPIEHKTVFKSHKPKLVIIIDDVSTRSQMRVIHATGLKLTPSIFPPSELSMTSHTLAKGLKHYMIHLPMESSSKQFNTQYKTLLTSMKTIKIQHRVKELRKLFPTARYLNNHTGSVFTDDYASMYILYEALRKSGFAFVDSRTIGSSKVQQIAKEFGDKYISRDIFIDNEHNVKYIHTQLKKAVRLARKNGYAIAIGHPHKITMQALTSAGDILSDVALVYLDDIYKGK